MSLLFRRWTWSRLKVEVVGFDDSLGRSRSVERLDRFYSVELGRLRMRTVEREREGEARTGRREGKRMNAVRIGEGRRSSLEEERQLRSLLVVCLLYSFKDQRERGTR